MKILYLSLYLLFSSLLFAQEAPTLNPQTNDNYHQIGLFWGSLRSPYLAAVSGIDYQSASFADNLLSVDARLQSWGSLYIISIDSFDLEIAAMLGASTGDVYLAGGLGYKILARLYKDERSSASTGYAPFIRGKAKIPLLKGGLDINLDTNLDIALYNNGIDIALNPQIIFGIDWFYVSLEAQGNFLFLYSPLASEAPAQEFRWDSFITLGVRL